MPARALALAELTPASRAFAERLLRACPQLRWHARTPESEEPVPRELLLELPSPTEMRTAPSWCGWRGRCPASPSGPGTRTPTSGGADGDAEVIALLCAIVSDRFVLAYDAEGVWSHAPAPSTCATRRHWPKR